MTEHKIVLLFGGESSERLVSVATAQNILPSFPPQVPRALWFSTPNESVFEVSEDELKSHQNPFKADFKPAGKAIFKTLEDAFDSVIGKPVVFFIGYHGGKGENGTIQRMLEERNLVYTGSSSKASALAFDKAAAKKLLREHHIRVAQSAIISADNLKKADEALHSYMKKYPRIVAKPTKEGSSAGIYFLKNGDSTKPVLEHLKAKPDMPYLVEAFIDGIELTVGVIENADGVTALPCLELRSQENRWPDYDGKYLQAGIEEICPAEVPDSVARAAQRVAIAAHNTLGCSGYSRTDIIVDDNGPVYLETNTLPGLTKASMVPQELKAKGISLATFIKNQIDFAVLRHKKGSGKIQTPKELTV
jgi:D-alanine-D-alanine ligase